MLIQERFKSPDKVFEKVYGIFDKRDYFNTKGLAKVQIRNFENFLKKGDKNAQALLDKFKGDTKKAHEYIIQVIHDRKKEQVFEDFKAFKSAVNKLELVSKGKSKEAYGASDLVKSRIHNNSQKYTIALYSAIRGKKFNNKKDVHADVDDLLAKNEGFKSDAQRKAAFANGYEEKGKKKNESVNEAISKTLKYRSRIGGDIFIEIEEDPAGIFVDVRMKGKGYNALLSTTDIEYPTGHINVTPRVKNIPIKESVNEIDTKKANLLRTNMPGYVGPKFAKKASDEDILAMADLKDQKARIYNRYVKVVDDAIAKLQKKYRIKESINEGYSTEEKRIVMMAVRKLSKYRNVPIDQSINDLLGAGAELQRDIKKGKIKK